MLTTLKLNPRIYLNNNIWIPIIAIFLRLHPLTADLSYLVLAVYSLFGRRQIIEALFLSWFLNLLNEQVAPNTEYESFSRYIVIIFSFFSILLRSNFAKIDFLTTITFGLGLFLIIHGIFFSSFPIISVLKALNWTLIILSLILAWKGLSYLEREKTKNWIIDFLFLIILISFIIMFISDIGYNLNFRHYQGILNHPQAFGLTSAALLAMSLGQLSNLNNIKLLLFAKIILSIFLLFASGSRTAFFAISIALIFSLFLVILFRPKLINLNNIYFNQIIILLVILSPILFLISKEIYELFLGFLSKHPGVNFESILFSYKKSRQVLYDPMINNIFESPIMGIGFGLPSDLSFEKIKYFQGIPVSAPIEKGLLPLAILEEIGLFGFLFFVTWIFFLVRISIFINFKSILIILTVLFFNLGEAGLFSPNGYGMLYLILITSVVSEAKKIKKKI